MTVSLKYIACLKGIYYSTAVKAGLSNLPDFKTNPGFLPSQGSFQIWSGIADVTQDCWHSLVVVM